jgi:hypothetical protein
MSLKPTKQVQKKGNSGMSEDEAQPDGKKSSLKKDGLSMQNLKSRRSPLLRSELSIMYK